MKTYSYGQTPEHVLREALPLKYSMCLNCSDMLILLKVLADNQGDWAVQMRTDILATLDIEEV